MAGYTMIPIRIHLRSFRMTHFLKHIECQRKKNQDLTLTLIHFLPKKFLTNSFKLHIELSMKLFLKLYSSNIY